jgi:hypothetical protein
MIDLREILTTLKEDTFSVHKSDWNDANLYNDIAILCIDRGRAIFEFWNDRERYTDLTIDSKIMLKHWMERSSHLNFFRTPDGKFAKSSALETLKIRGFIVHHKDIDNARDVKHLAKIDARQRRERREALKFINDKQQFLDKHPDVRDVRDAGTCECCRKKSLVSYTFPEYQNLDPDSSLQECGYYCLACGWAIPGSRKATQEALKQL